MSQMNTEMLTQGGSCWLCEPFAVPCSVWRGWGSKGKRNWGFHCTNRTPRLTPKQWESLLVHSNCRLKAFNTTISNLSTLCFLPLTQPCRPGNLMTVTSISSFCCLYYKKSFWARWCELFQLVWRSTLLFWGHSSFDSSRCASINEHNGVLPCSRSWGAGVHQVGTHKFLL